ncbi:MAG: right-handed parallel beta-helix repeat-containing protein, partial [Bacteroidaceae bacterium]|nr:right-handed parallel beta-helix repeat-containing protein [Bacteroidaceae bacterium]
LAFAGMLAVASCSQDDFVGGETAGDYVDATFTVSTADGISTRATIGNGTKANKVACTIYDANGKEMDLYQIVDVNADKTATYKVRLAKGQEYTAVFFAYNNEGNYYNVEDLTNIQVIGGQNCNDEKRDAFTGVRPISAAETMNTIVSEPIVLKRPLAQLNLGIDKDELKAAKKAGIVIEKSKIKVSNVYNAFNALTSTVVGDATAVEFAMNVIPTEKLEVDLNNDNVIDEENEKFTYLALNYLLVGDLNSEKTLTDVEFVWEAVDGKTNVPSTNFPNVRTQRNYRTNILGKLITNPATFNLVIDERFDGNKQYDVEDGDIQYATVEDNTSLQATIDAAEEGTTIIKFTGDIDGTTTRSAAALANITIVQKEGVNLVFDGCGYSFNGVININGNARSNGAETLTFRNINFKSEASDFTFISAPSKVDGRYNYSHNVTIEDCTFEANQTVGAASLTGTYNFVMRNCTATNMHSILQLQSCDNNALVDNVETVNCKNGLSFGNTAYPTLKNSTINAKEYGVRADGNASRGNLVIENTTVNAIKPVIVRKMTTESYNVKLDNAELVATGLYHVAFTNGSDDEAYVAPTGKFSIEGADNYNVYPRDEDKDVFFVANSEQLVEALENGKSVEFLNDIKIEPAKMSNAYGATGINVKNGQTIDGAGYTLNIKGAGGTWDSGINTTGGLIKNITVTGSFRGIFINHTSSYSEKVVLENVTIGGNGTVYTISCDQGLYQGIEATNCTFNGWTSFAKTAGEAKFINCSFGEGSTYKYCRPYSKTEFVECTFCPGYGVDKTQAEVTFTDCTWEE